MIRRERILQTSSTLVLELSHITQDWCNRTTFAFAIFTHFLLYKCGTQDWCNRTTFAFAIFTHLLLYKCGTQTRRGGDTTHGGAEALMTWCNADGGSAGKSIDPTPLVHHVPQHALTVTTRGDGTETASGLLKQRRVGVVRVTSKTSGGVSVSAPTA